MRETRYYNGWQRTTNASQTGDQVRSPAEENGEEPDRRKDRQKEEMKSLPDSSDETASVPDEDDKSAMAINELIRVLEAAAWAGVDSVGLEWQANDLLVFHAGEGHAATNIPKRLQLQVIAEIVERAHIGRKHKGIMRLPLHGQEYSVAVEEYDRFGESAFTLTLKKKRKKVAE